MKTPTGLNTSEADAELASGTPKTTDEAAISISEETVHVEKRERVMGRVRVRTVVDTVEEFARAALQTQSVEVTRVPVDRVVDQPPAIRTDGEVTIVPVVEEVLVVEKRLVLKEELHIRRRDSTEEVEVPVTLRKQRAVVEREGADSAKTEE